MSTKETSQPGNAKKANSSSFIISISLFVQLLLYHSNNSY